MTGQPRRHRRCAPGAVRHRLAGALLALLVLAVGGCVTTGTGSDRGDPDSLSEEEIRTAEASTLYDVILRLRPRWLRQVRNRQDFGNLEGGIVVYQDQSFLGGPEVLRQWGKDYAVRIVYLDGVSASNRLPGPASNRHVEGAIVIHTR